MRIVFAGTPDFSVPSLKALLDSDDEVVAVYTQPDRPAGRGRKLTASPVKLVATAADIPVEQPVSLRKADAKARLREYRPDLVVVVAYGLILPQSVLDIPELGCWNIHASLLPRWRGAAPIQRAILAGDEHSGVCVMQMEAGLDTGPVLARVSVPIRSEMTGGRLHDRLATVGAAALISAINERETLVPEPQLEEGVTYAEKITTAEAVIDWQSPAADLANLVRAFNPWPVARGDLAGEPLRIWAARPAASCGLEPGEVRVVDGQLWVGTGDGSLVLVVVQRVGGRRVAARDYVNGREDLRHQ